MTGNRVAHPLLLSLANLDMDYRMKSSNRAFALLALLPIPKFLHQNKKMRGVLGNRLFHECLDFVLHPLKVAASIGIMMDDPLGYRRFCFTPLVSCIVDTPEAALYAGVGGKTSPVTMASYKEFGNAERCEPRTASTTLAQLQSIEAKVHPWDLEAYMREAKKFRLNGVHRPFWRDWPLAEPTLFLTPELLHHSHKMFWDHDAKWCIRVVGAEEIDFRFSVLQRHTGLRHLREGISQLKQVTGREHRDVQRYIIGVIAGAVPKDFLIAVRALEDFRYLSQSPELDENTCTRMTAALQEFHRHKDAIITARARLGKGNKPIDNWHIPKLELAQTVVPNVQANGVAMQWSADVTEHAHITEIKMPAEATNNQNYEEQICRYLDRQEKCSLFEQATSICTASADVSRKDNSSDQPVPLHATHSVIDYFHVAMQLEQGIDPHAPRPFRTFAGPCTAFHLARKPNTKQLDVDEVAAMFQLPDLKPALADYLQRALAGADVYAIGGHRRAAPSCPLEFPKLEVWSSFRIQSKSFHNLGKPLEARTVNCSPPDKSYPFGLCDAVLVNTNPTMRWPKSGLKGILSS